MKPWQILFCLICVLGVPALVKFGAVQRLTIELSPGGPGSRPRLPASK